MLGQRGCKQGEVAPSLPSIWGRRLLSFELILSLPVSQAGIFAPDLVLRRVRLGRAGLLSSRTWACELSRWGVAGCCRAGG